MALRRRKKLIPRADGYAAEFAELREELKDFIERIPGGQTEEQEGVRLRRGHRAIPIEFLEAMAGHGRINPLLKEVARFDADELRARLAYYRQLSDLRKTAKYLMRSIEHTLDFTKAQMTATALPAYAVAKALARTDPTTGPPVIAALRKSMRRAGRAGRKKTPKGSDPGGV
jgi:hypothetical protein